MIFQNKMPRTWFVVIDYSFFKLSQTAGLKAWKVNMKTEKVNVTEKSWIWQEHNDISCSIPPAGQVLDKSLVSSVTASFCTSWQVAWLTQALCTLSLTARLQRELTLRSNLVDQYLPGCETEEIRRIAVWQKSDEVIFYRFVKSCVCRTPQQFCSHSSHIDCEKDMHVHMQCIYELSNSSQ